MRRTAATYRRDGRDNGFTLIELLVVISIIVLIATSALPGIMKILRSGGESQGYNLVAAQLMGARAVAIEKSTYSALHIQWVDQKDVDALAAIIPAGGPKLTVEPGCWVAVLEWRNADTTGATSSPAWFLAEDYTPHKLPGTIAAGEIRTTNEVNGISPTESEFVTSGAIPTYINLDTPEHLNDFMSLTIIFAPDGSVVKHVQGKSVRFEDTWPAGSPPSGEANWLFLDTATLPAYFGSLTPDEKVQRVNSSLWNTHVANDDAYRGSASNPPGEYGVSAMVIFDRSELMKLGDDASRRAYLNNTGRLVPINVYTGQVMEK